MNEILADIERDEEIAWLRSEVARLREIAFGADTSTMGRLKTRLDLTPAEAWMLTMLYSLAGDVLSRERMIEGMPGHGEERDLNSCNVIACRLRKKLGDPALIETVRGLGYRLNADGVKLVNKLSTDC